MLKLLPRLLLLFLPLSIPAGQEFHPGEVWLDTEGTPIQAHGGGILVRGRTYYWYGEDRTPRQRPSVSAYVSTNLYDWLHLGVVLSNVPAPAFVIERPKVIFNQRTRKYVMWMHLEQRRSYQYARAGIATSDRPEGPFAFQHALRPITNDFAFKENDPDEQKEFGGTFRDMNLFVDDDGRAYAFYASEGNWTMYVVRLNREFTGPEIPAIENKTWARIHIRKMREAPAPFKWKGRYYLITSACTGWRPNAADYAIATNILGPWESKGNPCTGSQAETTFGTQSTFVLPVAGRPGGFIFMADRWNPEKLSDSRYVWLPLQPGAQGNFSLEWRDRWDLSVFPSPKAADLPAPKWRK